MNIPTEIVQSCKDAWDQPNSLPKWGFCYALMVLAVMSVSDKFAGI